MTFMTKNARTTLFSAWILVAPLTGIAPVPGDAAPLSLQSYVEVLRADLRSGKVKTLTAVLSLDDPSAKVFWPLYHEYEIECFALGDRRLALARQFVAAHRTSGLDGETSGRIATAWFQLEQERLGLLKDYHQRIAREVSVLSGAQFVQIENRIGALIDLVIAANLPLIRTAATGEAPPSTTAIPHAPPSVWDPLPRYIAAIMADLRNGKVATIAKIMNLGHTEARTFWPLYHEYEIELFALGDRRLKLLERFLSAHKDASPDEKHVAAMAREWFELEAERLELLKKYHCLLMDELSATRAAQFTQLEHRVGTVIDLTLASKLPLRFARQP
jgi:hypothetical protein